MNVDRLTPEVVDAALEKSGAGSVVYLIGAGGCGMSGLGHLLLDLGHGVAGSDLVENAEVRQLRERGATIHAGHAAANLAAAQPALVAYSAAIRTDNPEINEARRLGVPLVPRAVLLAALLRRQDGICVAGMHGKTTTSAMLAFALDRMGVLPSYAVGGVVPQLAFHARFSPLAPVAPQPVAAPAATAVAMANRWFVIEADESDGTLSQFEPQHAIVLNIDEEHLDHYGTFQAVSEEFARFAERTRGLLVYCADDPNLVALFAQRPNAVSFGFNLTAKYRIEFKETRFTPEADDAASSFAVWRGSELIGNFSLRLPGEKNISNAAAVVALLTELGHGAADIARVLYEFRGAARRQQELYRGRGLRVFDDYGHHPAEISSTLRAIKGLGCQRLLVAFQPHRYTRTRDLVHQFATCFQAADRLWLTDIYAASETPIAGINGLTLVEAVRHEGQAVEYKASLAELRAAVKAAMRPGDTVLFLGAGDITRAAHELSKELQAQKPITADEIHRELKALLGSRTICRRNEPLAKRTTLRVGGPADVYVEPDSEAALATVLKFCADYSVPVMLLGRGSNLLIRDGGIRGVVICLANDAFSRIEVDGEQLRCGAGARLKNVSVEARRNGLAGLEFLEGIPGSIGGALRMNAGAMGAAMFEVVESVRFMDLRGRIYERHAKDIEVHYRHCPLFKSHIALGTVLKGRPDAVEAIEERMSAYSNKRWNTQPRKPSAGCIFKNPVSTPAGKLVDQLQLKGTRVGGAAVSDEHGNFIVNDGNATAADVLALIEIIKIKAKELAGIELQTEVEIVGEPLAG
ncbi:MAG: UDP-N-acetylmuramate dehydrogenase [Verrucomicrobiota bacterium]